MRYDRQIRIWNKSGQDKIHHSKVLCLGDGYILWEVLKNLTLGGFGTLFVMETDFIKSKISQIQFFNPEVNVIIVNQSSILDIKPDMVLELNYIGKVIDSVHFRDIPSLKAYSNGFYGYISTEFDGFIARKKEKHIDLMIRNPFKGLKDYFESFNLDKLNDYEYAHVPYPVFLYKVHISLGENPSRAAIRSTLKTFIRAGVEMDNIQEAIDHAYYLFQKDIDGNVVDLFSNIDKLKDPLKSIITSVSNFYAKNGRLPVSIDIPDLKATTGEYLKFKNLYSSQFDLDCREIQNDSINYLDCEDVKEICRNIRDYKFCEGSVVHYKQSTKFEEPFKVEIEPFELFSFLNLHRQYRVRNQTFPQNYNQLNCDGVLKG
eukprot:NODE_96_length_20709_cov_1.429161.p4 type:complete len:374 gc:universal NODE_96_length_20709_cov_1.429161:14263-15384(+)